MAHPILSAKFVFLLALSAMYCITQILYCKSSIIAHGQFQLLTATIQDCDMCNQKRDVADEIVQSAYKESYAVLEKCNDNVDLRTCLKSVAKDSENSNLPWWFRTLLRDTIADKSLFEFWHTLRFVNPDVELCTIEKVATTQWRKLSCMMNEDGLDFNGALCYPKHNENQVLTPNDEATKQDENKAKKVVFLRDPLERYLSAYLNKCVDENYRTSERHCEPNVVFNSPENGLTDGIQMDKRTLFEAYVDAMPLKWNMHFFPLGLQCGGLYRTLPTYDFVGKMGKDFYQNVADFGALHGTKMSESLETVFHYQAKLNATNVGVETSAMLHVKEYYSARTLRRVLQYLSIDYVTLQMPIPEWAREMLEKE